MSDRLPNVRDSICCTSNIFERNNHSYCLQGGSISAPASTNQSSDEEGKEASNKLIEDDIAIDGSEIKTKKHKKSKKKSKHTDEEEHYNMCDNNSDDDIHDKKSKKKKKKKDKKKSEIEYTDGQPDAPVEIDDTNEISQSEQKDENVNDIEDMPVMQGGSISAPASRSQSSDEEGKEASNKLIEDDITTDGSEIKTKKHKKSKKKSRHTDEETHYIVCDNYSDDDKHDKKSKKKKKKKDKKKSEIEYIDGQPDAPVEIDDTNKISQSEQKDENMNDIEDMPVMDDSKRKKKKKEEKEQSHDTTSEVTGADSYHDTIQNTKAKATKRKRMQTEVQEDEEDETTLGRNGNNEDTTCTDSDELVPGKKRKEQREDAVDYDCSSKLEKSKISENCETNIHISETKTIPKVSKKKKAKRGGSEKFSNNPSKYFKGSNLGNIPGYGR